MKDWERTHRALGSLDGPIGGYGAAVDGGASAAEATARIGGGVERHDEPCVSDFLFGVAHLVMRAMALDQPDVNR